MPLVSVVVPTHNRPDMLAEALASVRAQTFADYEVLVVSNGESDVMRALSRACAERFGATFFELAEGNVSAARNFAIARASGEWIAFLDDDDIWLPAKLERQLAEAGRTGADMVACNCVQFYPDGHEEVSRAKNLRHGWTFAKAIHHQRWGAQPSAVMVQKHAVVDAGGFDKHQRYCEDLDLWRRIAWQSRIHQMDEALVRYRQHAVCLSRHTLRFALYDLRYFRKMWRDTPAGLRDTLPSPFTIARRWLLRTMMPKWLRQPRKQCMALYPWLRSLFAALTGALGS